MKEEIFKTSLIKMIGSNLRKSYSPDTKRSFLESMVYYQISNAVLTTDFEVNRVNVDWDHSGLLHLIINNPPNEMNFWFLLEEKKEVVNG